MGSVAAEPLLSCVLDYRTIGFQALRQPLGRSAIGVGSGLAGLGT